MANTTSMFRIRFRSPEKNNNGDRVTVDHIDLIGGNITGMTQPGTPAYNIDTNPTTHIIATFKRGDWKSDRNGSNIIHSNEGNRRPIFAFARDKYLLLTLRGRRIPRGILFPIVW